MIAVYILLGICQGINLACMFITIRAVVQCFKAPQKPYVLSEWRGGYNCRHNFDFMGVSANEAEMLMRSLETANSHTHIDDAVPYLLNPIPNRRHMLPKRISGSKFNHRQSKPVKCGTYNCKNKVRSQKAFCHSCSIMKY